MSEFIRRPDLEELVYQDHGIQAEVFHMVITSTDYEIKIVFNGREAIIHEHMKNGLTKFVVLTTDKACNYKKYNEAEDDAIEYLKGQNG